MNKIGGAMIFIFVALVLTLSSGIVVTNEIIKSNQEIEKLEFNVVDKGKSDLLFLEKDSEFYFPEDKIEIKSSANSGEDDEILFDEITDVFETQDTILLKKKGSEELDKSAAICSNCNNKNKEVGDRVSYCDCDEWEKCYDYFRKSKAYNYDKGETATDSCEDSQILKEVYIDCWFTDEIKTRTKDCNDLNEVVGGYEYYCSGDYVRKRQRQTDYDCANGACFFDEYVYTNDDVVTNCNDLDGYYGSWEYYCETDKVVKKRRYRDYYCSNGGCKYSSEWRRSTISNKGDDNYCSKRAQYTADNKPGCDLCGHSDYNCDRNSQCKGSLVCKKPGGKATNGCCYKNEEWDTIEKKCKSITCSKDSDCGTNGYVGSKYCSGKLVYQKYRTHKCNKPGTMDSSCSNSDSSVKIEDCGSKKCYNGNCVNCVLDSDCGTNTWIGSPFCQSNDLLQKFKTYVCNNAGTTSSSCTNSDSSKIKKDCGNDEYDGNEYCYNNDVYDNFLDRGCSDAACYENEKRKKIKDCGESGYNNPYCILQDSGGFKKDDLVREHINNFCRESTAKCDSTKNIELVKHCDYGCEAGECLGAKPDLIVEDLVRQKIEGREVTLAFTITNVGGESAEEVYWMVDTDSSDANPKRTSPISLGVEEWTRAYMKWTYASSGNYKPEVFVDFDNLIQEVSESNNKESISVSV